MESTVIIVLLILTEVIAGQDEMIELGEREATEAVAEKEAAEAAAHAALMKEANLEVHTCVPSLLHHACVESLSHVTVPKLHSHWHRADCSPRLWC